MFRCAHKIPLLNKTYRDMLPIVMSVNIRVSHSTAKRTNLSDWIVFLFHFFVTPQRALSTSGKQWRYYLCYDYMPSDCRENQRAMISLLLKGQEEIFSFNCLPEKNYSLLIGLKNQQPKHMVRETRGSHNARVDWWNYLREECAANFLRNTLETGGHDLIS